MNQLFLAAVVTTIVWSGPAVAMAATLQVGADKPFSTVNAAVAAAQPGDVIEVDAGEYVDDVSTITTSDLTIRGVSDEPAHLRAEASLSNRKGILAIELDVGPITIENLEFSGAAISEADGANGAGIRMQGSSLVVRNCHFHDNQNGILAGGTAQFDVRIENSEFGYNGTPGSGFEHNVYVSGDARRLDFVGNYSHHAYSGHNFKSRAQENYVLYNRLMDEADGTGSFVIDLSEGGLAYVVGNLVQQGPMAENTGTVLSYNREGSAGPQNRLFVVNNTFVNDNGSSPAFVFLQSAAELVLRNNLFVGSGEAWVDAAGGAAVVDEGNLMTDGSGLVDRGGYDYRLLEGAEAIDAGVDPGVDGAFELAPDSHYAHPSGTVQRPQDEQIDVGAYEFGELPGGTGGSGGADGSGGDDGSGGTPPGGDDTGPGSGDPSGGGTGMATASAETLASDAVEPEGDADDDDGGCGCRAGGGPGGLGGLLLGGLLACRRRFRER